MKLPPFTLTYRPGLAKGSERGRRALAADLGAYATDLASTLGAIKPALRRALLRTVETSADRSASAAALSQVVHDLGRQEKVETVGFWDLSSQVGGLPRVIEACNRAQPELTFFEVQAAVPSGLISRPERVVPWAEERLGEALSDSVLEQIGNNLIFEDFAERAQVVRRELGLDHLIGIVPAMIAFEEDENLYWNFFTGSKPRLLLVSTFEVFAYSRAARRPFEVGVAVLALSTLLATLNPKVEFHEETRGCLFDFNRERATLVQSLRRLAIEPECLAKLRPKYQSAAEALVRALRDLGTGPGAKA